MSAISNDAAAVAHALARCDRYLTEVVEGLNICPWARPCRQSGRLRRAVSLAPNISIADTSTLFETTVTDTSSDDAAEVVLLIHPRCQLSYDDWESLADQLRHTATHPLGDFHVVAFHPEAPDRADTPARTTLLLRRSPDRMLQFVRKSVLAALDDRDDGRTTYVDRASLERLPSITQHPASVSDMLAQRNHQTVQALGPARVRALLSGLRG